MEGAPSPLSKDLMTLPHSLLSLQIKPLKAGMKTPILQIFQNQQRLNELAEPAFKPRPVSHPRSCRSYCTVTSCPEQGPLVGVAVPSHPRRAYRTKSGTQKENLPASEAKLRTMNGACRFPLLCASRSELL